MTYDKSRIRQLNRLTDLPDYVLGLIWFNSVADEDKIIVSHNYPYILRTIADFLPPNLRRTAEINFQPRGARRAYIMLRADDIGIGEQWNFPESPPPIAPLPLAKSFIESKSIFTRRNDFTSTTGYKNGFYIPSIRLRTTPMILDAVINALAYLEIAPRQKQIFSTNHKIATAYYKKIEHLMTMHSCLSEECNGRTDDYFWTKFHTHIMREPVPYEIYTNPPKKQIY